MGGLWGVCVVWPSSTFGVGGVRGWRSRCCELLMSFIVSLRQN